MRRCSGIRLAVLLLCGILGISGRPARAEAERFTVTYLGDCTFSSTQAREGSALAFDRIVGEDYGYPFKHVRSYLTSDDLTIANLECVLTDATRRAEKRFTFRARPEYVQILTGSGIEAVNLANNHANDLLEAGKRQMLDVLSANGVTHFEGARTARLDRGNFHVGLVGYNAIGGSGAVSTARIVEAIQRLRADGCNLVIVSCHWGIEGSTKASAEQRRTAKLFVDAGADAIVGHHPHRLQPIEKVGGKTVLYSLGNFVFGGNTGPSTYDTALVQETFERLPDGTVRSAGLNVVPCDQRSDPARRVPNYQPMPVAGEAAKRIQGLLGWTGE